MENSINRGTPADNGSAPADKKGSLPLNPGGFSLNRNMLKYIAIAAMVIDHLAWSFVPASTAPGFIMHLFGRITAPCMCFFVAEGFAHTGNKLKYGVRLGIFALISWIPYHYFGTGKLPFSFSDGRFECNILNQGQSMIYTLFLCFIALCFLESQLNVVLKIIAIAAVCVLDLKGDWHVMAILMTLFFYLFRKDRKQQIISYAFLSVGIVLYKLFAYTPPWYGNLFQAGQFLFIPLLMFYNGEKGSSKPFHKWFFYIFYPAHLLLLGFLRHL